MQSSRIVSIVLFILSLGSILLGYLLLHPELVGWCAKNLTENCLSQNVTIGLGKPLFWSTYLLPILFFILIFVKPEVFKTWAKVFVPFAIVGLLFIMIAPPIGNPLHLEIDRTRMTQLVVEFLFGLSVVIVAWKYWRLRRNNGVALF
jgi:hypothetical protein